MHTSMVQVSFDGCNSDVDQFCRVQQAYKLLFLVATFREREREGKKIAYFLFYR